MNEITRLELKAFLLKLGVPLTYIDEAIEYLEKRIKDVSQETVDLFIPKMDPP